MISPGPWKTFERGNFIHIVDAKGFVIADLSGLNAKANGPVIAEAWALLEAAEDVLAEVSVSNPPRGTALREKIAALAASVRRAKGGADAP